MANADNIDVRITGDASGAKDASQQAAAAVSASADSMQQSIGRIESTVDGIRKSFEGFKKDAEGIHKSFEMLGLRIDLIKETFRQLGEILQGGPFAELAEKAAEYGESIEHASQKTGVATDTIQELRYAAAQSNVSFDALQHGLERLSLKLAEAGDKSSPTARALQAIGLSAKDVKDVGLDEALGKIADKFAQSEDGAGKTAVAMMLLGRSGAELIPLLNKGSAGIDEFKEKAQQLGIVFKASAVGEMAAYDEKVKEIHAVHEAMALQVGQALIPDLLQIQTAFQGGLREGGPFQQFLESLKVVLKDLAIAASYVAQWFQSMGTIIGAALASATNSPALSGKIWDEATADIGRMTAGYEKFRADVENPLKGPALADRGVDFGGGGDWDGKKKKISVPDKPTKTSDGVMAQLEAELAAKKAAIAQQNAIDGTFYEMSKAAEAEFWQSKLAIVEEGSKEQAQISRKYSELKVAENKDALTATLAGLDKEIVAARYNFDEKIRLAEQELTLLRQAYGDKSKQVEEGEAKILKLRQAQSDQLNKLAEQQVATTEQAGLAEIALEEQIAQQRVQLGTMTQKQMIDATMAFENRRYAIEVEAMRQRAALSDAKDDPVQKAKLNAQLEQLEQQHQLKMNQIIGQAAMQQTQLQRALTTSLEQSFNSLVNGMLTGTLKIRDVMKQAWQSIANALSSAVTQMVSDWAKGMLQKKAASADADLAQIQGAAASAAGNAYDAMVGIPYVGPFLAPVAAAVAYAGVMAFGSSVPSAEGGYDIPAGVNPLVQTHAKEMILPAKHADVIRSMADGGGGGAAGGDVHLHVHTVDGDSVKRLFRDNGQHIVSAIRAQRRAFNPA